MLPLHRQLRPLNFSVGRKYFLCMNPKSYVFAKQLEHKSQIYFLYFKPTFQKLLILSEYKTKAYKVFEKNKT